jgi:hypothetical protein
LSGKRPITYEHEWMGSIVTLIANQLSALHVTEFRPIASPCAKFAIFNKLLAKIWPGILKKTVITLQALRFKLKSPNQTCISLKSIMQLARTICFYSATFIEKRRVENRLWPKSEFLCPKQII